MNRNYRLFQRCSIDLRQSLKLCYDIGIKLHLDSQKVLGYLGYTLCTKSVIARYLYALVSYFKVQNSKRIK